MIEDKLTPAQRIRLESVAQANMRLGQRLGGSDREAIAHSLAAAREIEAFILGQPEAEA